MVRRAKEYIHAGDIIQVVLAQRFETRAPRGAVRRLPRLRIDQPVAVHVLPRARRRQRSSAPRPRSWCGVEDGEVTVRPIAGTRAARHRASGGSRARAASCVADPKEIAEHVMLVDLGRNDVGRVAAIGYASRSRSGWWSSATRTSCTSSRTSRAARAPGSDAFDALPRDVPGRHALGRAEDPRDGDHRRARAGAPRRLRRRRRLLRLLREHGHRHRDPHGGHRRTGASTCRRRRASSPTRIPSASMRECVNKARGADPGRCSSRRRC